jgi:opacity protein-like surface antigen
MTYRNWLTGTLSASLVAVGLTVTTDAIADSGFYIGGSAGGATLEASAASDTPAIPEFPSSIDEDDTAFKVFAGYNFDLPLINLGVEAGYVDFGEPEIDVLGNELRINTTGLQLWGIAGIEVAVVDLFAKLGYINWDVEATLLGESASTDGSDLGYGVGVGFGLGPVRIRGEYELYDIDDFDLSMLSVGIEYRF